MTTLILIRHGQSMANLEGVFAGNFDADLSDLGREQAEKTAAAVKILSAMNIGVEGEIGHIGSAADGVPTDYTTVEEAKEYIEKTGVSALAVALEGSVRSTVTLSAYCVEFSAIIS